VAHPTWLKVMINPMGGDVHVTRAGKWWESDRDPITLDEWVTYVKACDDLRMEQGGSARWTGHPDHEGGPVRFSFPGDHVSVGTPDVPTTRRLHELAAALGGRVQGEDGEVLEADPPRGARVVRLFPRD
jgi:hypothetical protein